ncbi:MAG: hypothetical protein K5657_05695 [Desulfovibrio sp.]|nr:hypothetical protein [Desulfovibrio sp.]
MPRFFLLFSVAFFFLLLSDLSLAFPRMEAGSAFLGEETKNGMGQKVRLTLLDGHFFVLEQIFFSGGKTFTRCMTGKWRQMDSGATLLLRNAHGLSLPLTVGATNLYGTFPTMGAERRPLLVLAKTAFSHPTFTAFGTMTREGSLARFEDSATGRVFTLNGEEVLSFPEKAPYFVDAEIAFHADICRLIRVRSRSQYFPSTRKKALDIPFSAIVKNATWWITFPSGLTVSCVFTEKNSGHGVMEVSGRGLYLSVPYTQSEKAISFSLSRKDKKMLSLCEAEELSTLLQSATAWDRDGSSLLLCNADGELAQLENAFFRRNTGAIGPGIGRDRK